MTDIRTDAHLLNYVLGMGSTQGGYLINQDLSNCYPAVLEVTDDEFDPYSYVYAKNIPRSFSTVIHNQWTAISEHEVIKEKNVEIPIQCWMVLDDMEVLRVNWGKGPTYWLVGDNKERLFEFFHAVSNYATPSNDTVLVFSDGIWKSDDELYRDVQNANRENLILENDMINTIFDDIHRFFRSKDLYNSIGVTWKRGMIFAGAPGNGKSACIRTIIKESPYPCLYVKSFEAARTPDAYSIGAIFSKARKAAPCILVLEDLDTFGEGKTRSTFLNELDGFEQNTGVLIIGTTNYPKKLDPAVSKRPSRFDRTFWFNQPTLEGRIAYLERWNERIGGKLRNVQRVAAATDGYSFAALQELGVSALVISVDSRKRFDTIIMEQVKQLNESGYNPTERDGAVSVSADDEWDDYFEDRLTTVTGVSGFSRV